MFVIHDVLFPSDRIPIVASTAQFKHSHSFSDRVSRSRISPRLFHSAKRSRGLNFEFELHLSLFHSYYNMAHSSSSKEPRSKRSKHSHTPSRSREAAAPTSNSDDEWVEKPTQSVAPIDPPTSTFTPSNRAQFLNLADQTDGYGQGEVGDTATTSESRGDFFSDMGIERKRKEKKQGVDPTVSCTFPSHPLQLILTAFIH